MASTSLRAEYAKAVLAKNLQKKLEVEHLPKKTIEDDPLPGQFTPSEPPPKDTSICIIGAGAAGLALALALQISGYTNITILEASERHG